MAGKEDNQQEISAVRDKLKRSSNRLQVAQNKAARRVLHCLYQQVQWIIIGFGVCVKSRLHYTLICFIKNIIRIKTDIIITMHSAEGHFLSPLCRTSLIQKTVHYQTQVGGIKFMKVMRLYFFYTRTSEKEMTGQTYIEVHCWFLSHFILPNEIHCAEEWQRGKAAVEPELNRWIRTLLGLVIVGTVERLRLDNQD